MDIELAYKLNQWLFTVWRETLAAGKFDEFIEKYL